MSLHLLTAPAGAGKTQYVVNQIRAVCESKPLARMLVVVPSGAQLAAFRERLAAHARATFGVTLTDFHTLYRDVLDAAGALPRLMPEAARYRVIRDVIRKLAAAGRLPYFAPIAAKPGFIAAVTRFIGDLKEGFVFPEAFADLAATPRTRDLASIYSAYQTFLRERDLADREGMGWLAHLVLERDARLYAEFDYVAADGFDQFNPTQAALLGLLAARAPRLDITLTYQPNRLAHVRFARTFQQFPNAVRIPLKPTAPLENAPTQETRGLRGSTTPLENAPTQETRGLRGSTTPPRAAPLDHLERYLFELNAPRVSVESAITLTAEPDRTREMRAIARGVKRLLTAGTHAGQIAVLFRHLDPYQAIAREVFAEFGIPFRVREGMRLRSNPLVAALVNLLALSDGDFTWRDTLDALRSPYFLRRDLTDADLARIERITREAVVVQGREAWRDAFVKPTAPLREDEPDTRLVTQLSGEEIRALRDRVDGFLARVTPPERAAPRDFVGFIEGIVGRDPPPPLRFGDLRPDEEWRRANAVAQFEEDTVSLRVIECARKSDPELAARDLCALAAFKDVLRGMVQAADILNEGELGWSDFLADLLDALDAATYDLSPATDGRVVISTVTQARGIPKDFVFLGGLVESEFPPRAPEDPLTTAAEREALRAQNIPLADPRLREETTLFYEAASLARTRLHLSYPYLDDDANNLYASPYVSAVKNLFTDLTETRSLLKDLPPIADAASLGELAVSLTRALADGDVAATQVEPVLRNASRAWRHSVFAREVEARRELPMYDEFSGVMQDPALRRALAFKFGDDYLWSASQFNEWGACGFRFFAKRLLQLEEVAEPEEGLDALTLGALYHEILEQAYRDIAARGFAVTADTLALAQEIMRTAATRVLEDAPTRFAFRPTAWWEHERAEMLRRLGALLVAEAERNGSGAPLLPGGALRPFAFEVPFGFKGEPALRVRLPIGAIRIIGKIDRIDRARDGVVLIDYKTGSTKIGPQEVIQGRNLQLPIYVLAAEAMGRTVANAFFVHIRDGETSGAVKADREDWLEQARRHMTHYVTQARQGAFAVQPSRFENGACAARCEFAWLCRVGRWNARDSGQGGESREQRAVGRKQNAESGKQGAESGGCSRQGKRDRTGSY